MKFQYKNIEIRIFFENNFIIVLLIGHYVCYNIATGKARCPLRNLR